MASMLCCNPINVDDDIDDMELEDVWELQRSRSKTQNTNTTTKKSKKFTGRSKSKSRPAEKNSKGYGLKRVKSTGRKTKNPSNPRASSALKVRSPRPTPTKRNPRAASTGRPKPSSGWGLSFGNEKKVSISDYVEKIDYPPEKKIAGRGRQVQAPPVIRRNRSLSVAKPRRRESDPGKKKKKFGWGKKKKENRQEVYYSSSESESFDNDYDEKPNFFSMM